MKRQTINLLSLLLEDYIDDDVSFSEAPYYVKQYIKSGEGSLLIGHDKELLDLYPTTNTMILYRGLNFYTEQDYKEFLNQVDLKNKIYINPSISSWTSDSNIALSFAMTTKKYIEFFSMDQIKQVSKQEKEYERITGYIGIVLEIEVPAKQAIDIRDVSVEDEILVPKGKYRLINYKLIDNFKNLFSSVKTEDDCISVLKTLNDKNLSEFTKAVKWLNQNKRNLLTSNVLLYIFSQNPDLLYYVSDVPNVITHKVFLHLMKIIKNADEKYKVEYNKSKYGFDRDIRSFIVSPDYYLKWLLHEDRETYFKYIKPYVKKMIDEIATIYKDNLDDYLRIKWENDFMKTILNGTGLYTYFQNKIGSLLSLNYNDTTRGMKKPYSKEDLKKITKRVENIIGSMELGESFKKFKKS